MNSEDTNAHEPCVEEETLLKYLLYKCDEKIHHHLRLGFPFQFLGFAALYNDKNLLQKYQDIHLPCFTPLDRLITYKALFTKALLRLQDTPDEDFEYPTMPEYPKAIKPDICKKFIVTAMRDGREMLDSNRFGFLSVFLLISRLGLRFDRSALADFENRCVNPVMEPKERIRTGLAILKDALRSKNKD